MADPLEQLSDSDLQALAKNDLHAMSDEGLKVVAASGDSAPPEPAKQEEPLGHKIIREGLPIIGQIGGGVAAGAAALPETLGVGSIPAAMGGAAVGNAAGNEAASWINHKIYGDEAPTYNSVEDAKRLAVNAGIGAGSELGGQLIGKGVNAAAGSTLIKPYLDAAGNLIVNGFNKAGEFVGENAAKIAEAATGAPEEAAGMGRDLLDKNMVRFGDTQPQIAARLAKAPAPTEGFDPFLKKPITIGNDFSGVAKAAKDAVPEGKGLASAATDAALLIKSATGNPFAIASYVGKKVALPRATSSLATTVDGLSSVLEKTPEFFGKWTPTLTKAAARGEMSLNATAYVLQQQDPEFRQKMQELNGSPALSQNVDDDGRSH